MPYFSQRSKRNLSTCHSDLQKVFKQVINHFDCTILEGHRGKAEQNEAYNEGNSQLKWPQSKHNSSPSIAVDVIPYPIDWKDLARIRYFAGFVMGVASLMKQMGCISHDIRWGGDWDQDTEVTDNNFNDLVHFELVEEE